MVFTVPMQQRASRRAVLAGLAGTAAGVLAGCLPGSGKPAGHRAPHPLTPVLAGTRALADRYRATIAGYPDLSGRLGALLADHEAHIEALRTAMGTPAASASASPSASAAASLPPDPAAALADLRNSEQAGQADAVTACLAAAPDHAGLIGSIAACRATHIEVLA